jgi:hypothetical protein
MGYDVSLQQDNDETVTEGVHVALISGVRRIFNKREAP